MALAGRWEHDGQGIDPSRTSGPSGTVAAEAAGPVWAPQTMPYPHDLPAPVACGAGGHRVRPRGHTPPSDLAAPLAHQLSLRGRVAETGTASPHAQPLASGIHHRKSRC